MDIASLDNQRSRQPYQQHRQHWRIIARYNLKIKRYMKVKKSWWNINYFVLKIVIFNVRIKPAAPIFGSWLTSFAKRSNNINIKWKVVFVDLRNKNYLVKPVVRMLALSVKCLVTAHDKPLSEKIQWMKKSTSHFSLFFAHIFHGYPMNPSSHSKKLSTCCTSAINERICRINRVLTRLKRMTLKKKRVDWSKQAWLDWMHIQWDRHLPFPPSDCRH